MSLYILTQCDTEIFGTYYKNRSLIMACHDRNKVIALASCVSHRKTICKSLKNNTMTGYEVLDIECSEIDQKNDMIIKQLNFAIPIDLEYVNRLTTLHNINMFIMDSFTYEDCILSLQGIELNLEFLVECNNINHLEQMYYAMYFKN